MLSGWIPNRINRAAFLRGEFEFSWAAGQLRERDFAEFKRELLVNAEEDIQGVCEAWWVANTWYPHHALSHRLRLAEQALRELLAEGLVRLVTWGPGRDLEGIPGERHDETLRSFTTWVVTESVKVHFTITPSGSVALDGNPSPPRVTAFRGRLGSDVRSNSHPSNSDAYELNHPEDRVGCGSGPHEDGQDQQHPRNRGEPCPPANHPCLPVPGTLPAGSGPGPTSYGDCVLPSCFRLCPHSALPFRLMFRRTLPRALGFLKHGPYPVMLPSWTLST